MTSETPVIPPLPALRHLRDRVRNPPIYDRRGQDKALSRELQVVFGGWHRFTPSQLGRSNPGFIAPEDYIGRTSHGSPILDSLHGTTIWREPPDVTIDLDATLAMVERTGILVELRYWIVEGKAKFQAFWRPTEIDREHGYGGWSDYLPTRHRVVLDAYLTGLINGAVDNDASDQVVG
jgi:hypothetical protein